MLASPQRGGGAPGLPQDGQPGQQGATQVSAMPLPPMQYISRFPETSNVRRSQLPQPPLPVTNEYLMFGQMCQALESDPVVPSLESQGIKRLYHVKEGSDRKRELHKLNHSILMNFLDLLDLLIQCPESTRREEKLEELNLLFINMHHLVNEFRPHQARETLRVMMNVQKRKRERMTETFNAHLDKVQETIEEALRSLPSTNDYDTNDADVKPTVGQDKINEEKKELNMDKGLNANDDVKENGGDSSVSDENRLLCDVVDQCDSDNEGVEAMDTTQTDEIN